MDIDTIQPGTNFTEALRSAVGGCDVLLAMIGPEWAHAKDAEGKVRLEDPSDWVRTELATALSRNIPVIPVLVGGALLPKTTALPEDLRKLFQYQTHELTDKRWEYDTGKLVPVLQKILGGWKPPKNTQSATGNRASTVGFAFLALLLVAGALYFFKSTASTTTAGKPDLQTNAVVPTPPLQPVSAPMTTSPDNQTTQHSTEEMTSKPGATAPTIPSQESSANERVAQLPSTAGEQAGSLPAGVEVKFNAGDLTYRLTSIQLRENTIDSWFLVTSFVIKNTGGAGAYVHYFDDFRLLIDGVRRSPVKSSGLTTVESDNENKGEAIFVVPKSVRTVDLRITRKEQETTIPIDFKSGISQSVVQPAGIPKALSRLAPMQAEGGGNLDFRKIMLEPFNVESLLLRLSIRITAVNEGFYVDGNKFRLVVDDLSYEPVRGNLRLVNAHTYADEEVLFLVPKSATRAALRYPSTKWESSIELKSGKP